VLVGGGVRVESLCRGGGGRAVRLCGGGLRKNAVCRESGWGLGLRPVHGLTGPKKARWAVSKLEYMYGYSYRHV
jgi:hypothetical protein